MIFTVFMKFSKPNVRVGFWRLLIQNAWHCYCHVFTFWLVENSMCMLYHFAIIMKYVSEPWAASSRWLMMYKFELFVHIKESIYILLQSHTRLVKYNKSINSDYSVCAQCCMLIFLLNFPTFPWKEEDFFFLLIWFIFILSALWNNYSLTL